MTPREFSEYGEEVIKLIEQKPDCWEYLLTVALMKIHLRGPVRRFRELQTGAFVKPRMTLTSEEVLPWTLKKISEARDIVRSFSTLYNDDLKISWGDPGVAGDSLEIRDVTKSIARTAELAVDWEADLKFANPPEIFVGLLDSMSGALGHNIPSLMEAMEAMEVALQEWAEDPEGVTSISVTVVFDLPPNWNDQIEAELELIEAELGF
jgi:hypothetical protein